MVNSPSDIKNLQMALLDSLLKVDRLAVKDVLTRPHPEMTSLQLIESLVVPVLEKIGSSWEKGEISLSQVYISGRICEEIVDLILPKDSVQRVHQPKMAIATLEDYHLLGKRIVYSTLRASGFEVENYGRMSTDDLARRVEQDQVKILLLSVLMLPSALRVRDLRDRLNAAGIQVKIVVGGAPFRFDPNLWREVGADSHGATAAEAVGIIRHMIGDLS